MTKTNYRICIVLALLFAVTGVNSEERYAGTAIVVVGDSEYTIPIECDDSLRPELGFSTEPSRITHKAKGRSSGITLRLRKWKDTPHLVISIDRYVAWVPSQPSSGGVLKMTLDMSPASMLRDGMPTALTYDMWMDGDRPAGLAGVSFDAQCSHRDPAAPSFRKLNGT